MNYNKDEVEWGDVYDWAKPSTTPQSKEPEIGWGEVYDWAKPPQAEPPEPPKPSLWDNVKSTAGKVGNAIAEPFKSTPLLPSKQGMEAVKSYKPSAKTPIANLPFAKQVDQGANYMGSNLQAGIGDTSSAMYNTLKSVGGDKVPGLNKLLDYGVKSTEQWQEKGGSDIGSQVVRSIPGAAQNMGLALMSGGASTVGQIPAMGNEAIRQATLNMLGKPTFINSALRSYGGAYGEARDAGGSRLQGISAGIQQALPQAMIEQAGGLEQIPNRTGQGLLKTIGRSALEEGLEEVMQYPFEGLAKKATYAPNTPLFSTKEQAVINPLQMGQAGLVGGLAGGLLGGAGGAFNSAINPQANVDTQAQYQPPSNNVFYGDQYGNVTQDQNYRQPLQLPPGPEFQQRAQTNFYTDQYGNATMDPNYSPFLQLPAGPEVAQQPASRPQADFYTDQYGVTSQDPEYQAPLQLPAPKKQIPQTDPNIVAKFSELENIESQIHEFENDPIAMMEGFDTQQIEQLNSQRARLQEDLKGEKYQTTDERFTGFDNLDKTELDRLATDAESITENLINEHIEFLKMTSGLGVEQGGITYYDDGSGIRGEVTGRFGRTSNNEKWYQDWARENNYKKLSNKDLRDIAIKHLTEGVDTYTAGYIEPNQNFIYGSGLLDYTKMRSNLIDDGPYVFQNETQLDTPSRMTPAELAKLNRQGLYPNAQRQSELLNQQPPISNEPDYAGATGERFSSNRITPGNLRALNKRGINPNVTRQSDSLSKLNPPIAQPDYQTATGQRETPKRMFPGERITPLEDILKPSTVDPRVKIKQLNPLENFMHPLTAQQAIRDVPRDTQANTQARAETASTVEPETKKRAGTRQESDILQKRKYAKRAKNDYEQIRASSKLSRDEMTMAEQIRKNKFDTENIPANFNRQRILDVASAGRIYDQAQGAVNDFNNQRKQKLRDTMSDMLSDSDDAKDKAGFWQSREIMERNNFDVFGEETGKKINEAIFRPVHDNEAKRTKFINKYIGKVKELNLSKAESEYVQKLGEGKIKESDIPSNIDKAKVKNAIGEFRKTYDRLISLANEVLTQNGYAPVDYRKDYFPHFDDPTDPFVKAMKSMGFKVDNITLPTDIAGITHQFRPGKKWFGNFLQRTGNDTSYNALEGFERYIHGISDVIYHTNDIQRLRAFETSIRSKYASENIQNRIAEIESSDLSVDEQQSAIDALFELDRGHLGNYVTNLRSYTDTLAGKKSISDRNTEHKLGRAAYNIFDNMNSQVAKGMVNWNVGSWLTNFIPIAQAGGGIKSKNLLKATQDTVLNFMNDDGFRDKSTFLTNRKGTERLTQTTVQKISDLGMAPMELIDDIATQVLTRGKYLDNIERGMSHQKAIDNADDYVAGAVADRSKGSAPTLFNEKNPIAKLFTMFQLEVNNQYSFLLKDLPREANELGGKWLAGTLLKAMVGSFIYNELYEKLTGRRPAIDPIGTVKNALEKDTPLDALQSVGEDVLDQTPFIGGLMGGGRLPTQAALPEFGKMWDAAKDMQEEGFTGENVKELASGALKNPLTYLVSPIGGGGQAKKMIEGIGAYNKGASTTATGRMRYPIEQTPMNRVKTSLFGQYSTPEGREYFDKNQRMLSEKQTQQVMNASDPKTEFERIHQQRQIDKLQQELKSTAKDNSLTTSEKDKKIIQLREQIQELRAAR